jgi:hypothetical protein
MSDDWTSGVAPSQSVIVESLPKVLLYTHEGVPLVRPIGFGGVNMAKKTMPWMDKPTKGDKKKGKGC